MKTYKMASKQITHKFCGECSSSVMIDIDPHLGAAHGQPDIVSLNVSLEHNTQSCWLTLRQARLFKDFNPNELTIGGAKLRFQNFDGFNIMLPHYEGPELC